MDSNNDNHDGDANHDSMPSSSSTSNNNAGASELDESSLNGVSAKDKEKYEYLSDFFTLEGIKPGPGKTKTRNLYFKCKDVECNTAKAKSCQESSMSNLLRHIELVHPHALSDFKKVYYKKSKLKRNGNESGE